MNFEKYRKKPIEIEAYQNEGEPFIIKTLEGDMLAGKGDWIIKGVEGELYPCKDNIFKKTYEKSEDNVDTSYPLRSGYMDTEGNYTFIKIEKGIFDGELFSVNVSVGFENGPIKHEIKFEMNKKLVENLIRYLNSLLEENKTSNLE